MRIAIIGAGMIGAAAARHLSQAGHEVILIGPDEPQDKANHDGVFASHYDAGRITRGLATDPFWAQASLNSIARYRDIETQSGLSFFSEVGTLVAGPHDAPMIANVGRVAEDLGIDAQCFSHEDLRARFPYFHFAPEDIGYYESQNAGTIDPRKLVAAQIHLAREAGAHIERSIARDLHDSGTGVEISTHRGTIKADHAIVAAGGFSEALLKRDLGLTVFARTVALFEVSEEEARRLSKCPSLIYRDYAGNDPYLLPPIRYPDGKIYLKLGGDPEDKILAPDTIAAWFRSGGSAQVGAHLTAQMRARMPDLDMLSVSTDACVTTFTTSDRPLLERHSDRITLATAGCGAAAKCSDELGRLAGEIALGRQLPGWAR